MKIVVFGPDRRVGALRGDLVVDLSLACAKFLKERQNERQPTLLAAALVPSDLAMFIEGGTARWTMRRPRSIICSATRIDQLGVNGETLVHKASEVRLHAPRPNGSRIACAGGNFADHLAGMAAMGLLPGAGAMSIDEAAARIRDSGIWGFWKVDRDDRRPGCRSALSRPRRTGSTTKARSRSFSASRARMCRPPRPRTWSGASRCWATGASAAPASRKVRSSSAWRRTSTSRARWGHASWSANSIRRDIDVETWVNGERRQQFNTRDMVFSFWEYIEYLSRDLTLYPGDIISGGTAAGTAADSSPRMADGQFAPERFLKAGDVVEIRAPAIGTLRARIVMK